MTNYEAIRNLTPEGMEYILDSIYAAGLNNGLYAADLEDDAEQDELLDNNPFDLEWLQSEAEDATRYVIAENGEPHVLHALAAAILRNAGAAEEDGGNAPGRSFELKISSSVEIRAKVSFSEADELKRLKRKMEELLEELDELEDEEPEDEDSDEYEEWEDAMGELQAEIEELAEEIEELRG